MSSIQPAGRYRFDRQIDIPAKRYDRYGVRNMGGDFRDIARENMHDAAYHQPSDTYDEDHTRVVGEFMLNDANFVNTNSSWRDHDGRPAIAAAQSHKRYTQLFQGSSVVGEIKRDQTAVRPLSGAETGLVFSVEEDYSRTREQRLNDRFTSKLAVQAGYQKERVKADPSIAISDEMRTHFMNKPYNGNGGPMGRDYQAQMRNESNPLGKWHDVREQSANAFKRLRIGADGEVQYSRDNRPSNTVIGKLGIGYVDPSARNDYRKEVSITQSDVHLSTPQQVYPIDVSLNSEQQQILDSLKPDSRLSDVFRGAHLTALPQPHNRTPTISDRNVYEVNLTPDDERSQLRIFQAYLRKLMVDGPVKLQTDSDIRKFTEALIQAHNAAYQNIETGDRTTRQNSSEMNKLADRLARDLSAAILDKKTGVHHTDTDKHRWSDATNPIVGRARDIKQFEDSLRNIVSAMDKVDERKSRHKSAADIEAELNRPNRAQDMSFLEERKVNNLGSAMMITPGTIPMLGTNEMNTYESRLARTEGAPDLPIAQESIITRDISNPLIGQKVESSNRGAKFGAKPARADLLATVDDKKRK